MGAESYKSYEIHVPKDDWRRATCEEIDCPEFLHGWKNRVEGLPAEMVHAMRHQSGRRYTELRVADGETWLVFEAGQPCFRTTQHRIRQHAQPELYVVRDGDHRGNPRGTKARLHQRPADWQEDFATHQQGLAQAIQEG
jgi:hypothetical protein